MPSAAPHATPPEGHEDSPVVWFAEMVMAMDRRDIDTAAEAKRRLTGLGWHVQFRKPRADRQGGRA